MRQIEFQRRVTFMVKLCFVKVKTLIEKKWDPVNGKGDIWVSELKVSILSSEHFGPAEGAHFSPPKTCAPAYLKTIQSLLLRKTQNLL